MSDPRRLPRLTERIFFILGNEGKQYTQKHIAKFTKNSKQAVHYHINKLLKLGLIEKHNLGIIGKVFRLTYAGKNYSKNFLVGYDGGVVRSHGLQFVSQITRPPNNPKTFMVDGAWRSNKKFKNWTPMHRAYEGVNVMKSPRSFTFTLDQIYSPSSLDGLTIGLKKIKRVIESLELEYPGLKVGSPKCISRTVKQSHALVDDVYAKRCIDADPSIKIKTPIHEVDASKGPELEFIDSKEGHLHQKKYSAFIDKISQDEFNFENLNKLGDVQDTLDRVHLAHEELKVMMQGGLTLMSMIYSTQKRMTDDRRKYRKIRKVIQEK